ncbi:MAG: hypothetical protein AAFN50_03870 [Pseudomonadota bacterium]
MRNIVWVLCATLALFAALPVVADEAPIYESLSDVSIGRVFFSTSQRAYLDRIRGKRGTVRVGSNSAGPVSSKPRTSDAAGYIVSSSGKARVYRNGDFVEVATKPVVAFPDDITVTRKPSADAGTADDEAR